VRSVAGSKREAGMINELRIKNQEAGINKKPEAREKV